MGLGTLLEKARQEQGLTIEEMSKRTKIRSQFLQAIEEEQYHLLPGEAYVKPFIRTYTKALGLEEHVMLEPDQGPLQASASSENVLDVGIRGRRERLKKARRRRFIIRLAVAVVMLAGIGYLLYRLTNV